MLRQRVFGICLGYEDCNDFDGPLGEDPMLKLSVGRLPDGEQSLASQPTLSRFENSVTAKDLVRMGRALVEQFVAAHADDAVRRIVLDMDATDDPAHGQQELEFFHGYYDRHCFLPLLVFASVECGSDSAVEQELIAAVLRPGNKHAGHRAAGVLRRIVARLKAAFPQAEIVLRGDAGFALPEVYDLCESMGIGYVLSLAKNSRLTGLAEPLIEQARLRCSELERTVKQFGEIRYAAQSWPRPRRVIVKAEVMPTYGDNPRFVVTNIVGGDPEDLYSFYTDRGDVENRIKELKNDLSSGRTSCHRFLANQFRLLMHAAAMIVMQRVRSLLASGGLRQMARLQVGSLRVKLLKVGARVIQTSRKIWLKLPTSYLYQKAWRTILLQT